MSLLLSPDTELPILRGGGSYVFNDVFERFQDAPCPSWLKGSWKIFRTLRSSTNCSRSSCKTVHQQAPFLHHRGFDDVVCRIRPRSMPLGRRPKPSGRSSTRSTTNSTEPKPSCRPRWSNRWPRGSAQVNDAMKGARPDWLSGYRTRILDGNHLPGTEHRLQELRTMRAAALPGHALVVLGSSGWMLATDVIPCEDGLFSRTLAAGSGPRNRRGQGPLDRRSQLLHHPFPLRDRGTRRLLRDSSTCLRRSDGNSSASGVRASRVETGKVFEQTLRATNEAGEILLLRRVTVAFDQLTRTARSNSTC